MHTLPDRAQTQSESLMVLNGMLLSDWISFVTCWCGHMANRHSLHRESDSTIWGSCAECEECKQFYPEDGEDRDKLRVALGMVMSEGSEIREKMLDETIASARQSAPHGTGRAITPLVIADLEERRRFGTAKYGEELTAFNERDALQDAYQEALDLVVYLRQAIEERDRQSRHDVDAILE